MKEKYYHIQTITLGKDQFDFLQEYRKLHTFIFSKFVQAKLDEFIKFAKQLEGEKIENDKTTINTN